MLTATLSSPTDGTDYSISINESTTEFLFEGAPQQECIQINILDDEIVEQSESFLVIINTTLTSQTVSLNPQYAFVTIIDDDRKLLLTRQARNHLCTFSYDSKQYIFWSSSA